MSKAPIYGTDGQRLTSCCGAYSTFVEGTLCCKKCYHEVPTGEGDGTEYADGRDAGQNMTLSLVDGSLTPIDDPKS